MKPLLPSGGKDTAKRQLPRHASPTKARRKKYSLQAVLISASGFSAGTVAGFASQKSTAAPFFLINPPTAFPSSPAPTTATRGQYIHIYIVQQKNSTLFVCFFFLVKCHTERRKRSEVRHGRMRIIGKPYRDPTTGFFPR